MLGLPVRAQAYGPKAAGSHPEVCGVLRATQIGRDKPAGPLERVSHDCSIEGRVNK